MRALTIAAAITLISIPTLAQADGKRQVRVSPAQQAAFKKGHCLIMRSPLYKPTRGQRIKSALRPLTLPKARRWIKKQGSALRQGLRNNRLTRLPRTIKFKRQAKLNGAIVKALRAARNSSERGNFSVGNVVSLKAVGHGLYDAKVAFLSKRSGGKTERMVRVKLDHGKLGLGKLLGRTPKVGVVGLRPGVSLSSLAPLSAGESIIAGQQTMLGIPGMTR